MIVGPLRDTWVALSGDIAIPRLAAVMLWTALCWRWAKMAGEAAGARFWQTAAWHATWAVAAGVCLLVDAVRPGL